MAVDDPGRLPKASHLWYDDQCALAGLGLATLLVTRADPAQRPAQEEMCNATAELLDDLDRSRRRLP